MKNKILSPIALLLIAACSKHKDNWNMVVHGHMYSKTDTTLYRNTKFIFYLPADRSPFDVNRKEDLIYEFSTDTNGYFDVTFSKPPKYHGLRLCTPENAKHDCGIPLQLPMFEKNLVVEFGSVYF